MKIRAYLASLALAATVTSACGDDSPSPTGTNVGNTTVGDAAVPVVAAHSDSGASPGVTTAADAGTSDNSPRADGGTSPAPATDAGRAEMDGSTPPKADGAVVDASRPAPDAAAARDAATADAATTVITDMHSAECMQCQKKYCSKVDPDYSGTYRDLTNLCTQLQGNATGGPKMGTSRTTLCTDLLKCEARTNCAQQYYADCLCGAGVEYRDCTDTLLSMGVTGVSGACRTEVLAAAESTQAVDIQNNYSDTLYRAGGNTQIDNTLGVTALVFECQTYYCNDECYGTCKGKPDGTPCFRGDSMSKNLCKDGMCPKQIGFFMTDDTADAGM